MKMFIEANMILISLLITIISALPDCPRNKPVYKEGICGNGLCYKAEYEQGICVVVNKIAKTQWVTSVIHIGIPNTYVYFQKYQNGDLILELISNPRDQTRMFYELKQNEEALLVKDGQFIPSQNLNSNYISKSGNLYIIKIGEEEYPVFFGMYGLGIELIDLKENNVNNYINPKFYDGNTFNNRGCNIFLTNYTLNNENYYLLAYNNGQKTSIKIINFKSKNLNDDASISIIKEIKFLNPSVDDIYCVTPISCFITDSNLIMCLYSWDMTVSPYNSEKNKIIISVYDEELNEENEVEIYEQKEYIRDIHTFKALHLKGNTGVFLLFSKYIYVITYIRDNYDFENYFQDLIEDKIELSIYDDNEYMPMYYTDLQKISDSKFCYISFAYQNSTTYKGYYIAVALLDFIGSQSMTIRYYYIKMNLFFGYALDLSCKFNIYNNYIALCFSAKTYEYGDQTAFMLLSYANNTNQSFDIIDYLLYNNEIKISNISYDLKEHLKIENNIFGYKIQKSEVLEKKNCEKFDMKFIKNNIFIQANSQLNLDDTIFKIIFEENENEIYYKGNCTVKLNLYITDPDFDEYDNYPDEINNTYGEFDENSYNEQKKIYGGKESFFNIELQRDLFTQCTNINCELCVMEDPDICITCQNNFTFDKESKRKICESNSSDTIEISDSIKNTFEISDSVKNTIEISDSVKNTFEISDSIKNTFEISDTKIFSDEVTNQISNNVEISNSIFDTNDISNSYINENSDSILDTIKTCNKEELINENIDENDFLSNEQIEEMFTNLTIYSIKCNNANENIILQAQNAIFELSTVEFQKYYDNINLSSVDLGQCENVLREKYNISNENQLLMLKMDIKKIETKSTYVQYEIYDSVSLQRLKLEYCKNLNLKIIIHVPAQLDSTSISLYENLKEWGYNLFDAGDPFYHDVCTLFTNQFGTDVIIEDRRKDYYLPNNNVQLCQEGCEFNSYDKLVQKAECYCNGQTNVVITDITKLHLDKDIIADSFSDTIKNSNFRVLKCYKKAFDFTTFWTNLGRIILTLILILFLILMIIYFIKEKKKIYEKISYIMKDRIMYFKGRTQNKQKSKIKKKKKKKTKKHSVAFNFDNNKIKENIVNDKNNIYRINVKKNTIDDSNNDKNINYRRTNKRNKTKKISKKQSTQNLVNESLQNDNNNSIQKNISGPPKRIKRKINVNSSSNINTNNNLLSSNSNKIIDSHTYANITSYNENKINSTTRSKIKISSKKIKFDDIDMYKSKVMEKQSKNSKINYDNIDDEDKSIYVNMNDQELNTLEYEKALIYDKRSYLQYYWSLLKKKQLILFTFYPQNDYNLIILKISLFLLGFSLYFTINAFFFSDDSMHKIYVDRGIYNFVYQLPQILFSSVVSAIINMILKNLSLSEKNIIELKQEKDDTVFQEKSKSISQYLVKKFLIFFILSILLLLFFWYFISCFCGVYVNTQIIFIKNTFTSFALSMVYPFGLNLLPGMFRIPALRDEKKEKKCLYKISGYVAMI